MCAVNDGDKYLSIVLCKDGHYNNYYLQYIILISSIKLSAYVLKEC